MRSTRTTTYGVLHARTDNPVPGPMDTAKGNDKPFCIIILPLSPKAHSLKLPAMDKLRPSLSRIIQRALLTSDLCSSQSLFANECALLIAWRVSPLCLKTVVTVSCRGHCGVVAEVCSHSSSRNYAFVIVSGHGRVMVIHHPGGKIHDASPWYSMFRNKYLLSQQKDIQAAHFIMEMHRERQSIVRVQSRGAARR